jgi:hypothetical protein
MEVAEDIQPVEDCGVDGPSDTYKVRNAYCGRV